MPSWACDTPTDGRVFGLVDVTYSSVLGQQLSYPTWPRYIDLLECFIAARFPHLHESPEVHPSYATFWKAYLGSYAPL